MREKKTLKILKSKGIRVGIMVLAPLLILALLFIGWAHLYARGVLSDFSNTNIMVAAFDQNTIVYGQNGDLITELHGEINRIPIALGKIPDHVQKAFVAVEDQRFYGHRGVDLKAILRAGFSYYRTGRITEGASTITQQVMKLYFLTPEQTLRRKIKEAALALEFEITHSKESILELYLNRVYFGEGAYGVQSAAKVYFGKDAMDLTLAEGALLAALIQAPSIYDPYINPEKSLGRRNVVLEKMFQQGYIPEAELEKARTEQLFLKSSPAENQDSKYPFYIDQVIEEAIASVGEEKVFRGGLRINSTLEPGFQKKAEEVFQRPGLFPSEKVEAALALVENETGAIKALVGGREYGARRGYNRSTQLVRQPGSAFKPISVYAPAFELGYGPDSIIQDTPFRAGDYEPRNSGGGFYGPVSIRTAVAWSRNVAAVRLLNQIGVDRGFEFANKLGFDLMEEDRCLPLALGGLTKGVSPLQMAGAYAAFANGGIYTRPYTIRSIETIEGRTLYRHPEGVQVMSTYTAESILSVLRSAVESGTGYRAGIRGIDVAGKTGTTELPDTPLFRGLQGNKDAWFVGITPSFTAAVWLGYDENDMDRLHYLTSYGGNQPAEIFRLVMAGILGADERMRWAPPVQPVQEEKEENQGQEGLGELETGSIPGGVAGGQETEQAGDKTKENVGEEEKKDPAGVRQEKGTVNIPNKVKGETGSGDFNHGSEAVSSKQRENNK